MTATIRPAVTPWRRRGATGAERIDDAVAMPVVPYWTDVLRRFRRNKLAVAGVVFVVLLIGAAVFAPLLARWGPKELDTTGIMDLRTGQFRYAPTARHWFGTDRLGRDLFARVLFGARISLSVAAAVVVGTTALSLGIGAVCGFFGRWFDSVFMRVADVLGALPYVVVVFFFTEQLGRTFAAVIFALIVTGWGAGARLFRSGVLQLRGQDFVEAARASGASSWRIITRHILPNAIQPMIVAIAFSVGGAVLTESVFSFLGIGITEPNPAWGLMVAAGRDEILAGNPHMFLFPAAALVLTVLSFTFIGEGLRDALDPKLRGS